MTVFKGFLLLMKRNLGMLVMYLVIFCGICIAVQMMTKGQGLTHFEEERLDIAVIDRDGGTLAAGLTEYLGERHNLVEVEDDKNRIQEEMFYRNIYYVVTIPQDFEQVCLRERGKLSTTKLPGTTTAFYVDQQINTFLNDVRVLNDSGFTMEEAVQEVKNLQDTETEVTLVDKNGNGGVRAPHAFMFQYMPYMILSVVCYTISFVMIEYRRKDLRRRLLCSAVPAKKQNLQLVLGYAVVGLVIWGICMLIPTVMYQTEFLTDQNLPYYLINALLVTLVAMAMAFVIGVFVKNEEVINGIVNVVGLGMCFTCGVFVSMEMLSKGVRVLAQFLPVYWYEVANGIIADNAVFTKAQEMLLFKSYGIQLLFAVAILSVGLVVSKYKEQEQG